MKRIICIVALAVFAAGATLYSQQRYVLTPEAPATPRINGARVYGARPGADFLYKIPATGVRPMLFKAEGLPAGLKLDKYTGIISGRAKKKGTYVVKLMAFNSEGNYERDFKIVIGDRIALTPPMGWNSWNCWGNSVDQEKVMSSAKGMLSRGLDQYGWSYINIDDGWQGTRSGKDKAIAPNRKFPDMKGLGDFLHENGLKFGIYSGPWMGTYAGHIGEGCDNEDGSYWWIDKGLVDDVYKLDRSRAPRDTVRFFGKYSFADVDAKQWAEWGVDYLKYDWYPNDMYYMKQMREALLATGRDIVYSISNTAPVAVGASLMEYAECWRTTGDIRDNWKSISGIGFGGQDIWSGFCRPGNWPDADMLVVGRVGWGPTTHEANLTPDEQYTHISLWALFSSPMLIGCDMAEMDDFTFGLLCNSEVIDINQDELGIHAVRIEGGMDAGYAVYLKPLYDGKLAVGLFNLGDEPRKMGFSPYSLNIMEGQTIHDVWRQKDVAVVGPDDKWETEVAPHGVVLVTLAPGYFNGPRPGFRWKK